MSNITVLDKKISEKIAAGEVITSPYSVVKELVENSIDADATKIVIEIADGGKSLIKVNDNGAGIRKDEVKIAFLPHATSKIKTVNDIDKIDSFGFRGEALGSILAISKLSLVTKTKDEISGSKIIAAGGEIFNMENIGTDHGTTITINSLFYNTPARKKFLRADKIESLKIVEYVASMAISIPDIQFKMTNNSKTVFSTDGKGNKLSNISKLLGIDSENIMVIKNNYDDLNITCYLSNSELLFSSRKNQLFFVNNRKIYSKLLENIVSDSYKPYVFKKGFPLAVIFIDIPSKQLDVNIHPQKTEIRFNDENKIREFLNKTITDVLQRKEAVRNTIKVKPIMDTGEVNEPMNYANFYSPKQQVNISDLIKNPDKKIDSLTEVEDSEYQQKINIANLEIIGQIFAGFILAKDFDSFYFVDQHAAHERINYEFLLKKFKEKNFEKQILLMSETINLPVSIKNRENKLLSFLTDFGFDAEVFGTDKVIIRSVPLSVENFSYSNFLQEIVNDFENVHKEDMNIENIISKACRASIKLTRALNKIEIQNLFDKLSVCENPLNCPHGRPIFVRFTKEDVEKMFKRRS
ncbi:MAG: DNA mismatch repair endonuclease MutL [Clostridiales Family XIII bacterium]|nr:DNA mismatch repair endonuclease MutL [Clostridiales Family XIII bacterium]